MKSLWLFALLASQFAWARPAEIVFIRHAEKPADGIELSTRGWQRAKALPELLQRKDIFPYGAPVALFAMAPKTKHGQPTSSVRAIQTLQYLSENLGLPVLSDFHKKEYAEQLERILSNSSLDGKTVLVCWEGGVLSDFAGQLGVRPVPAYPKHGFDRVWRITWGQDGRVQFADLPERLLAGDDQN